MPYYTRVFCKSGVVPTIEELETTLKLDYPNILLKTEDMRDGDWSDAELYYKENKEPIIINCDTKANSESLAAEECQEFIEKIGKPRLFKKAKKKVLQHLKETQYIIACQLLNDIDDDGYHMNGELMNFFSRKFDGLIQADGEGFYEGYKVIVKLK